MLRSIQNIFYNLKKADYIKRYKTNIQPHLYTKLLKIIKCKIFCDIMLRVKIIYVAGNKYRVTRKKL